MDLKARIQAAERKTVALAKALSDHGKELEELKKLSAQPAPPVRRQLKRGRLQEIENFYTSRKLKQAM